MLFLFDLDGTLLDSIELIRRSWLHCLEQHGRSHIDVASTTAGNARSPTRRSRMRRLRAADPCKRRSVMRCRHTMPARRRPARCVSDRMKAISARMAASLR